MEKFGVDGIKKVVFFALHVGNAVDKAAHASGAIGKAAAMLPLVMEIPSLVSITGEELKNEYADYSVEEKDSMKADVAAEFNIADDELEGKIELAFDVGLDLAQAFHSAGGLWSK